MTGKHGTVQERFERYYIPEPNSGCWIWIGSLSGDYGQLASDGGKPPHRAHVLAYQLYKGEAPKGLDVRHSCDTRCCVNPDHLSLGTRKENMQDAVKKKRHTFGSKHPEAKLTDAQVVSIRRDTRKHKEIAAIYGISSSLVSMLQRRRRWKHL